MYLSKLIIVNFKCFGDPGLELSLRPGLTILVGENDASNVSRQNNLDQFAHKSRDGQVEKWLTDYRIESEGAMP